MVGGGCIGGRGVVRLLMVCAVLAGLFLMHGAPASAAEGCHGTASAPMPAAVSAVGGHGEAAAPMSGGSRPAMVQGVGGRTVHAEGPSTGHGVMCVSTPSREHSLLPPHAALPMVVAAVPALWALAGLRVVRGRAGRRGPPPPGGRGLLLQVGVART